MKNKIVLLCLTVICFFASSCEFRLITGENSETFAESSFEQKEQGSATPGAPADKTPVNAGNLVYTGNDFIEQRKINFTLYKRHIHAKGIYITANIAGISEYFEKRIELVKRTEINSVIIDIKNDEGFISVKGKIPVAEELGTVPNSPLISDIEKIMASLDENNVYKIARIVSFKDTQAAKQNPELALRYPNGDFYTDGKIYWLNPYNKENWEYIASIAKSTAEMGFDEIQFDYIRFPTAKGISNVDFGETNGKTKVEIINEFAKYIKDELKDYNIVISADVFGTIITSKYDADLIGQDYAALAGIFDVLCPMIYPSHYTDGSMGITSPIKSPYETIYKALEASNHLLEGVTGQKAIIRPWVQDFSIYGVNYGVEEVKAQIQAIYDTGHTQWLLWNSANVYTEEALQRAE